MALLKRLATFFAVGALLGAIIATLVAPGYLVWDNTTRSGTAVCSCAEVTRETAEALIRSQLLGAAIGAGAMLILGIVLAIRGRGRNKPPTGTSGENRAAAPVVPPTTTPPATSPTPGGSGSGGPLPG